MKFYEIKIPNKVAEVYQSIATELDIPIQKVLSDAIHLYSERLTLESFDNIDDLEY